MSMDAPHQRWFRTAILVAAVYLVIGIAFGTLAGAAASRQVRFTWRLAAYVASALAFGAHIAYEHFRLRTSPRITAWHAAAAVALGAFGLALSANVHAYGTGSGNLRRLAIALVAWPLLCGLPAFIVALAAAAGLTAVWRTPNANSSDNREV